jgi:alginate O-acetyltransferase complex protein AlgI
MTPVLEMSALVAAVFAAFKLLTARRLPPLRLAGYLALWPGMDPAPFAATGAKSGADLVAAGLLKAAVGSLLLAFPAGTPWIDVPRQLLGVALLVHFGLCDVLAGAWRLRGVGVERLFDRPWAATSLSEFWGRRWNRAFSAVARERVYRPAAARWGRRSGLLASFAFSGLVHELLLSVPARGGWGLPTLYFLLHGLLTASEGGRRRGRAWTAFWVLAPLPLLFHPWFLRAILR